MSGSPPSPSPATTTTAITDLNEDSIGHCANYLTLHDICNMAMSSTALKRLAYSDSVWQHFFAERWHQQLQLPGGNVARELYLSRHTMLQQFKFKDPLDFQFYQRAKPFNHLLLHQNLVYFTQGSIVGMINLENHQKGVRDAIQMTMSDHKARITCMRLFSLWEQDVLVTSSCDHSIRLWLKGSWLRSLRGHNCPVLSLSNKLLGDDSSKVLASGGEDGTVRLWSLSSTGKRGQHALKATLYGHVKPVNLMSVSGHRTSLLVTMSSDSKVRVWDTDSSAVRSSCCVGMTSVHGAPVDMKCHESLLYVAAGSSVTAVDLRTMKKVITAAVHQPKLYSFDAVPSKSLLCTGGDGRAMLWDIRRNQELQKPGPVAELDGHYGPVTKLYMDQYKIVTGGPDDAYVNVWGVGTGEQTNSLLCSLDEEDCSRSGCDAMAVNGCRITTASSCEDWGVVRFRDFNNATCPVTKPENEPPSKFWDSMSDNDDRLIS